jgi:hypothetical protein
MRGPSRPATCASSASSGSSEALVALDDEQRAERGVQMGVDGVGQSLAHGGGGDRLEQAGGKGHAAIPWVRRVRMAVETRCRAATVDVPSRCAMES